MPDSPPADTVEVFKALCWSRAYRWKKGLIAYDREDRSNWIGHATEPLQRWAETHGLVERIGQDGIQALMAAAFEEVEGVRP